MLQTQGRDIDCVEAGEGPALLFVPGSYSTVAAWRSVQRLLRPGLRMVTTSLCGYGASTDTRTRQDLGMHHEVQLVEAVARHVGQPVHLVGHSFGAAVALATALAARVPIASLTLFEANPLNIIRDDDGGKLYQDALRMSLAFEAAVAAAEPDAPGRIIDYWGGAGVFANMPEAVKAYCRETATVNVLDWHCAFSFGLDRSACSALRRPVLLVRGALANQAMKHTTDTLQQALPQSRMHIVDGAGHFLINSHPAECAQLLSAFLDEVL